MYHVPSKEIFKDKNVFLPQRVIYHDLLSFRVICNDKTQNFKWSRPVGRTLISTVLRTCLLYKYVLQVSELLLYSSKLIQYTLVEDLLFKNDSQALTILPSNYIPKLNYRLMGKPEWAPHIRDIREFCLAFCPSICL